MFRRNQKLEHEVYVKNEEDLRVLKIILELMNIDFTTEEKSKGTMVTFYVKRKYSWAVVRKIQENLNDYTMRYEA